MSLRHHHPKDLIDTRRIARAELLKPFKNVGIQTHGHQLLGRTPELRELLIGERWNIGIVDIGNIPLFLSLRENFQRRPLAFSQKSVPDRFGARVDLPHGPR